MGKSRETTTTHSETVNVEGSPNGCNDYEDVKLDRQIEMLLAEMNLEEESDTTSSHDHLSSGSSNNNGSVLNIHDDFAQALGSHEESNVDVEIILFDVLFKDSSKSEVYALVTLEWLKAYSPSLLLQYLQGKLKIVSDSEEDEEDDDETLVESC